MAIFSNFEGTLKSGITLGRGTGKAKISTDGTSFTFLNNDGTRANINIKNASAAGHPLTKGQFDAKVASDLADAQANDGKLVSYSMVNSDFVHNEFHSQVGGYVKLNNLNKIDTQFIPSISFGQTYIVENFQEIDRIDDIDIQQGITDGHADETASRDAGYGIQVGDILRILPIQIYQPGIQIEAGKYYRFPDYDNESPINDTNDFFVALNTFQAADDIATSVADTANWASTDARVGPFVKGDEVLTDNVIYVCTADTPTAPVANDATGNWVADGPDSGAYICTKDNDANMEDNWTSLSSNNSVTTFGGRIGTVVPESGDYDASMIALTNDIDGIVAGTSLQSALPALTTQRLNRDGDSMTGVLTLTEGTAAAPSLVIPGNTGSGIYETTNNNFAIARAGTLQVEFNENVELSTNIDMLNNKVHNIGAPIDGTDAVNKNYIDALPTIHSGTTSPVINSGTADGDVFIEYKNSDIITSTITSNWTSITSDGSVFMAASAQQNGDKLAKSTDNGDTWQVVDFPNLSASGEYVIQLVSNSLNHFIAVPKACLAGDNGATIYYTTNCGETME